MISMIASVFPAISATVSHRVSSRPKMRSKLVALCAALLFTILGQAQQSPQVLHNHVRPVVSNRHAARVGRVPSTHRMQLSLVLPLRNQAGLTALISQIYDPSSPHYRHFLSVDQFTEQFGPSA